MRILFVEDKVPRRRMAFPGHQSDVERLEQYEFLELRSEIDKELFNGDLKFLGYYDLLMIHSSYLKENFERSKVIEVERACRSNECNLLLFSGGADHRYENKMDSKFQFLEVRTQFFYSENLFMFLDECDSMKHMNFIPSLLMIRYGASWRLHSLLKLKYFLNRFSVEKNGTKKLEKLGDDFNNLSIEFQNVSEGKLLEEVNKQLNSILM